MAGIADELCKLAADSIRDQLDAFLIGAIAKAGYTFEARVDLERFVMKRCAIEKYPNGINVLVLDGKEIAEWHEKQKFNFARHHHGKNRAFLPGFSLGESLWASSFIFAQFAGQRQSLASRGDLTVVLGGSDLR